MHYDTGVAVERTPALLGVDTVGLRPGEAWLGAIAAEVRRRMLLSCLQAGTGHVGGCSAAVELLSAAYFGGVLRIDPADPRAACRDRVLVRGHLGPLRYAIFSLLGWVDVDELAGYATLGSRLQGHETPDLPGVDIGPSGSLGMLLSYGVGSALTASLVGKGESPGWRTWVFLGDGEEQEGNVAEAARHAAALDLPDLVVVLDVNGKQLAGPTSHADRSDLAAVWRGYGWRTLELTDGNDVHAAAAVLGEAAGAAAHGPIAVIAHTVKGHGLPGAAAHFSGFHELSHSGPDPVQASLTAQLHVGLPGRCVVPNVLRLGPSTDRGAPDPVRVESAEEWPSSPDDFQLAYLTRLAESWRHRSERLYFLYADTFPSPLLARTGLDRAAWCANVGIREQHLIALAHGIASSDPGARIIAHTGDAFVLRAVDQLHAALTVGSRLVLIGDDAGLTNSRNGASHQSALTPLVLAGLPGLHHREPVDGLDFALALNESLSRDGVTYIRLHDGVLSHPVGVPAGQRSTGSYLVRPATDPDVLVLAAGYLVGEAMAAAEILARDGIAAAVLAVVDPSAASPVLSAAIGARIPVLTVYDGHPDVLGSPVRAIAAEFDGRSRIRAMGFTRGASGRLAELLGYLGLDANHIAEAAAGLLDRPRR